VIYGSLVKKLTRLHGMNKNIFFLTITIISLSFTCFFSQFGLANNLLNIEETGSNLENNSTQFLDGLSGFNGSELQRFSYLSKLIRNNIDCQGEAEKIRILDVHRQMVESLLDYSVKKNDLKRSISHFIFKALDRTISADQVIDLAETELRGGSRDLVFQIKDEDNKAMLIVKAFVVSQNFSSRMPAELSAMAFIRESLNEYIRVPEPLAVGKCIFEESTYALLIETVAPGIRYSDLAVKLAKHPLNTSSRREAFEVLSEGIKAAAAGLAELQRESSSQHGPFPYTYFERLEEKLELLMNSPKALTAYKLEPLRLVNYVRDLKSEVLSNEYPRVYCHGDGHLSNYFYHANDNAFTMIDLDLFHRSIDYYERPLGPIGFDYIRFLEDLEAKTIDVLTYDEFNELKCFFQDSFIEVAGQLPPENLQKFYYAYKKLHRLIRAIKHLEDPDCKEKDYWQKVLDAILDYFIYEINRSECQPVPA
jgi:Phosphotransferase enzyme family